MLSPPLASCEGERRRCERIQEVQMKFASGLEDFHQDGGDLKKA